MMKRLIDASPLDRMIMRVPDDVYDERSYIRGVEDVLDFVRSLPTEDIGLTEAQEIVDGLVRCQDSQCDDCTLENASGYSWDCIAYDKLIERAVELLKHLLGRKE